MVKSSYECKKIINELLEEIYLYKDLSIKCWLFKPRNRWFFTDYLFVSELKPEDKLTYIDEEHMEVSLFQALVIFIEQNSILDRGETAYKLIAVRNIAGLSQSQLAEKLNIDVRNYAKWETGERIPKIESLKKIFNACGVEFKYYFE